MSWREELQDASFRGVPFFVSTSSYETGRRTITHEFPGRDLPWVEDLGKAADKFKLECFVVGPEYMAARDALINALRQTGPGRLIHPYYGEKNIVIDGRITVNESTREGGLAKISVNCVEAGEQPSRSATSTTALLDAAANVVNETMEDEIEEGFHADSQPEDVRTNATSIMADIVSAMRSARRNVNAFTSTITDIAQQINEFSDALGDLLALPGSIASQVVGLCSAIFGAVGEVAESLDTLSESKEILRGSFDAIAASATGAINKFRRVNLLLETFGSFSDFGDDIVDPVGDSPQTLQKLANQQLLVRLVRVTAVAEACRAVGVLEFDSQNHAEEVRDTLADAIEELCLDAGDDLFAALTDLRATLFDHVTDLSLPGLSTYTPNQSLPALIVAHLLYGDATRDQEIVERNNVAHPGSIQGGTELEVLSA